MPRLALDIESTGLDPLTDRIVELVFVDVDSSEQVFSSLFNPEMAISPEAQRIHGIEESQLEGAPLFEEHATAIQRLIDDATLVGYGSYEFDTVLLDAELRRSGEAGIDLSETDEIDLLRVWRRCEPRTLEGAVERFLGQDLEEAHRAGADASVLPELIDAMAEEWGFSGEDLRRATARVGEVDRAGRLWYDQDRDEVVFAFGRHSGEPVRQHQEYLDWMLTADFPAETKKWIQRLREARFEYPVERQ